MNINRVLESGFIEAFIHEYYEYKIHSFYPDRMRLLYILCGSEMEKTEVTKRQIENCKHNIHELGHEELSYAYLLSCRQELGINYICIEERYGFWLKRFAEEFEIFFPDVNLENEIKSLIDKGIAIYDSDEKSWEFEFLDYEGFDSNGKPTGNLFVLPELFVQLDLLIMYRSLLEPDQPVGAYPELLNNPRIKFISEVIDVLINILNDYFDESCHMELHELFISGKNQNRKLVFIGSAIQLTDTFKKLIENKMIIGCNKQYLEKWLIENFMYINNEHVKEFTLESTHKSISGKNYTCKNPIIQIRGGRICKFEE